MPQSQKLSLLSAILINVNIMLGSGIFINTVILTKQAGSLGAVVYLLVALLLLPLILTIGQLLDYHPTSGTFYDFGRTISPYFGFISSWSYFTAKLCSSALAIHVCLSFLQQIIPLLKVIPLLLFDCLIAVLFVLLNLLHIKIGQTIQYSFIILKLIPILFVILTGLFLISGANFTSETALFSGVPLALPLVLYAFSGFEASCSLSSCIRDAKRNGPLAIFISFGLVVTILFLFQGLFYGSLGPSLGKLSGYLDAFPAYLAQLNIRGSTIQTILYLAIAIILSLDLPMVLCTAMDGICFTLARNHHIFGSTFFSTLNEHGVPRACIIAEGVFIIVYLLITQGNQIPLQQVSALGGTIAYTFSAISLLFIHYNKRKSLTIPLLGLVSCLLFIGSFIWSIKVQGPTLMLLLFLALLGAGSYMFYKKHETPLDIFEEL